MNKIMSLANDFWPNNPEIRIEKSKIIGEIALFEDVITKEPMYLDANLFFGKHVMILGTTGMGKSNTMKTLLSEICSISPANATIIDPVSDYWVMKELFPKWRIFGMGEDIKSNDVEQICIETIETNTPTILCLNETPEFKWASILIQYLNTEWKMACDRRAKTDGGNMPHINVIEECHEFIPQHVGDSTGKQTLGRLGALISGKFAKQGRRHGTVLWLATQRAADISKKSITQCEVRIFHKIFDSADFERYKSVLGCARYELEEALNMMGPGDCILKAPFNNDGKLHVYHVRKLNIKDVSKSARIQDTYKLARGGYRENGTDYDA